jgi:hypothetical protein
MGMILLYTIEAQVTVAYLCKALREPMKISILTVPCAFVI